MEQPCSQAPIQSEYLPSIQTRCASNSRRFAPINLHPQPDIPGYDDLIQALATDDGPRTNFLRACLTKLGLDVSLDAAVPSLSNLYLSSMNNVEVDELLFAWEDIMSKEDGEEFIRGENDVFHVQKKESRWSLSELQGALPSKEANGTGNKKAEIGLNERVVEYNSVIKKIVPHGHAWPDSKETPNFHHGLFYSSLKSYQRIDREAEDWGKVMMYGEVVTSTNTLLEK
jgi:biotin---protein ligase